METFSYINNSLHIDEQSLEKIARKYETPLYVYSQNCIRENFLSYREGFGQRDHLLCYSVKANSNLAVLKTLVTLGAGFDIVSGGELARVLQAGAEPEKIVFSGVGKTADEISNALDAGILCFNVESGQELRLLESIAKEKNLSAPFSLRVNPDVDPKTHPYISTGLKENKFGITLSRAQKLYLEFAGSRHLEAKGIDCHIGSQITDLAPFAEMVEKVLQLENFLAANGIKITQLDFGGGLGINYRQDSPPQPRELAGLFSEISADVRIIIEPGRSIVGKCGCFITKVLYLKHGELKNFCIVDGAMNDLARPYLYNAWQRILPLRRKHGKTALYDVVGPVCESSDFLGKDRELNVSSGSLLAVMDSGAYGFAMASNYNSRPRAAEVMVTDGKDVLARKRETVNLLYAGEIPKLAFTKMHGLGNDFMVIDQINQQVNLKPETIAQLADRNLGVGFDQLLLVGPAPDDNSDFSYRIFNADGLEVNQCGNGARCFARFVRHKGFTAANTITVRTRAGFMTLEILGGQSVRVDMGSPVFSPGEIPLNTAEEKPFYEISVNNTAYRFMAVGLGNPHAVIEVDNLAAFPVGEVGGTLESHPFFPVRANIGFMQIIDTNTIKLRVFERGSGETLSCGSGACAAAVCGIKSGKLTGPVTVNLPGGDLSVEWNEDRVYQTGPAQIVYEGEL